MSERIFFSFVPFEGFYLFFVLHFVIILIKGLKLVLYMIGILKPLGFRSVARLKLPLR